MKLAPVLLATFVLVEGQHFLLSMHPRFHNIPKFSTPSLLDGRVLHLNLYGPSEKYDVLQAADPGNGVRASNPFSRLHNYGSSGLYFPPDSSSARYRIIDSSKFSISPFRRFWLNTRLFTTHVITTVTSLSYCIPANQFLKGATNTSCVRRRREVPQILFNVDLTDQEKSIEAAPVNMVETTALPVEEPKQAVYPSPALLSSSKEESRFSKLAVANPKRLKRLTNIYAVSITVTSYVFSTTFVPKTVTLATGCVNGNTEKDLPCLLCVPLGYGIC